MKKMKWMTLILALVLIVLTLCACTGSKMRSLQGSYVGSSGSLMILYKDGTGQYQDNGSSHAEPATWRIEGDTVIVYAEDLGYEIYADISSGSSSLLFQSDRSRWNDELFQKVN